MKKVTPKKYLEEVYPGTSICTRTVTNWIKKGKLKGEQTPSGRWLVVINEDYSSEVDLLLNMMLEKG